MRLEYKCDQCGSLKPSDIICEKCRAPSQAIMTPLRMSLIESPKINEKRLIMIFAMISLGVPLFMSFAYWFFYQYLY